MSANRAKRTLIVRIYRAPAVYESPPVQSELSAIVSDPSLREDGQVLDAVCSAVGPIVGLIVDHGVRIGSGLRIASGYRTGVQ